MNRMLMVSAVYLMMGTAVYALEGDAGTNSGVMAPHPGTPSAPAVIAGPMPSEQQLPVSKSQMKATDMRDVTDDTRKKRIDEIGKQLESKKLSAKRREDLEKELTDLNVKTLINQPASPKKR